MAMASDDRWLQWGIVAGTGFFLLGGLAMCWVGVRNTWWAWRSAGWPTAPATIAWTADDIEFRYRVNGQDFRTTTIHFGQTRAIGDSSETRILQLRYPDGAATAVRVHPGDPSVAVAEPGLDSDQFWLPIAGLFVAGVAFLFLLLGSELTGLGPPSFKGAGLTLFGGIFAALGAMGLWFGGARLWKAQESIRWPRVPGEIVFQQIDTHRSTAVPLHNSDREPRPSATFAPSLVFRYQVDGRTYYSNLRRFGQLAGSSAEWAEEIAERYPEGTKIPVFHDPGDPAVGVLETGWNYEAWFLPGAGLAAFGFGFAVVRWGRRALC